MPSSIATAGADMIGGGGPEHREPKDEARIDASRPIRARART